MRKILSVLLFCGVVGLMGCSDEASEAREEYWPKDEWRTSTPEEQGMDSEKLVDMFDYIDEENTNDLHGLIIIKNGNIVVESYSPIYFPQTQHDVYSVTKSFLSAVVGVAVDEGVIALDDRILDFFPDMTIENMSESKKNMTVEQFLTMTSGIPWTSEDNQSLTEYNEEDNRIQYYLDFPILEDQVDTFNYDTGSPNVLGVIIEQETGMSLDDYAAEKIFDKIGVDSLEWFKDDGGWTWGGSGSKMTPRDMARFGYLYLHNGQWDGEQIVPEDWVEESTSKQVQANEKNGYGYYFWLTELDGHEDYYAQGAWEQYIFVAPEDDLIVVQTGDNFHFMPLLYDYILPAIKSDKPIDANEEAQEKLEKKMGR